MNPQAKTARDQMIERLQVGPRDRKEDRATVREDEAKISGPSRQ